MIKSFKSLSYPTVPQVSLWGQFANPRQFDFAGTSKEIMAAQLNTRARPTARRGKTSRKPTTTWEGLPTSWGCCIWQFLGTIKRWQFKVWHRIRKLTACQVCTLYWILTSSQRDVYSILYMDIFVKQEDGDNDSHGFQTYLVSKVLCRYFKPEEALSL